MIPIDQEPDYVPKRLISRSGGVVTAMIIVSVAATIGLAQCRLKDVLRRAANAPTRIESTLFEDTSEAERMREVADERLRSYGWVNQQAGTIHVPLEVAIEQYLGAQR